jgi:hypothetical protein
MHNRQGPWGVWIQPWIHSLITVDTKDFFVIIAYNVKGEKVLEQEFAVCKLLSGNACTFFSGRWVRDMQD